MSAQGELIQPAASAVRRQKQTEKGEAFTGRHQGENVQGEALGRRLQFHCFLIRLPSKRCRLPNGTAKLIG